ncbi:hypothetical protein HAX54_021864 [Datura stramonium]|uniref:Uncharacterized protein n=1 Tax=Datura stramonium TaxID=4076 RepID=A0ABS8UWD6_DATST|nr:hypothetical protein [Datura stramonium]
MLIDLSLFLPSDIPSIFVGVCFHLRSQPSLHHLCSHFANLHLMDYITSSCQQVFLDLPVVVPISTGDNCLRKNLARCFSEAQKSSSGRANKRNGANTPALLLMQHNFQREPEFPKHFERASSNKRRSHERSRELRGNTLIDLRTILFIIFN